RAQANSREPSQMQIEQAARKAAPAPRARNRDRENFGFVGGATRQNEAHILAPAGGTVGDHIAIGQKLLEFVLAPAAIERGRMERRERGGIARARRGQYR